MNLMKLVIASLCFHTYCLVHLVKVEQLGLTPAYHWNRTVNETSFASAKDSLGECFVDPSLSMNFVGEAAESDSTHSSYCTWRQVYNLSFSWQLHSTNHHLICKTSSSTCPLGSLESHGFVPSLHANYSSPFSLSCYWQ